MIKHEKIIFAFMMTAAWFITSVNFSIIINLLRQKVVIANVIQNK